MNIGILGFGKEGQSAEKYFTAKGHEVGIIDNFTPADLAHMNLSGFDLILRSPSVHPQAGWSSMTQYFFDHCPCPIIGVTGTKGKGTTCSLITALLKALGQNVYLVGNIGNPAIDILDQLQPTDVVVYELSSFQLWDLEKSPHIAVITTIEPDHLNVHDSYDDYVSAKANIAKYQTPDDYLIYHLGNSDIAKIAAANHAQHIEYPTNNADLTEIISHLALPGQHNRDNAEAALFAVASYLKLPIDTLIKQHRDTIIRTLETFQGLPHRLQFLRELNHVKYYDDNFSTTPTSLEVALKAFPEQPIILIVGGRDKTGNQDLPEITQYITNAKNIEHTILIGESGRDLLPLLQSHHIDKVSYVKNLSNAVDTARTLAENITHNQGKEVIVLMSPAAASFDMFENVYARGAEFQKLIQDLQ